MKYPYITIIAILFYSCSNENQLRSISEITYWSQESIDNFTEEIENTMAIENDVYLDHTVNNISAFRNVKSINGELKIQNSLLQNTSAFQNLKNIGQLVIVGNANLKLLEFEGLESISEYLIITENNNLMTIQMDMLVNLNNSGIDIVSNQVLSFCSFEGLLNYHGLNISNNPSFSTLIIPNPIPEEANYNINLEFEIMRTDENLFKNSQGWRDIKIKADSTSWSNLKWLQNAPPSTMYNIEIESPIPLESLCDLKDYLLQTIYPANFKVKWENEYYTGEDIIIECQ